MSPVSNACMYVNKYLLNVKYITVRFHYQYEKQSVYALISAFELLRLLRSLKPHLKR